MVAFAMWAALLWALWSFIPAVWACNPNTSVEASGSAYAWLVAFPFFVVLWLVAGRHLGVLP